MGDYSINKRMIGAVVLVVVASLLLTWLLKGKSSNNSYKCFLDGEVVYSGKKAPNILDNGYYAVYDKAFKSDGCVRGKGHE